MSIIGFPLLLIPVAICNIVVFLMPGLGFDAALASVTLPSGAVWAIRLGDVVVALGVLLLLPELIKAARPGARYVTDHLLSLLVLGGTVTEIVMLPQFGNATMVLLATLALVDFLAGLSLRRGRQAARGGQASPAKTARPRGKVAAPPTAPEHSEPQPPAPAEPVSASAAAASMAEAVLLDRPQPVTASAGAAEAAAGSQPSVR